MPTAEILEVVTGVSSVLGLLGLVAYLYSVVQVHHDKISVRTAIGARQTFTADDVLQIMDKFPDSESRMIALEKLTEFTAAENKDLLDKVQGSVDLVRLSKVSSRNYRVAAISSTLFFSVLAAFAYSYARLPKKAPDGANTQPETTHGNSSAKPTEKQLPDAGAHGLSPSMQTVNAKPAPAAPGPRLSEAESDLSAAAKAWKKGDLDTAKADCDNAAALDKKFSTDRVCESVKGELKISRPGEAPDSK